MIRMKKCLDRPQELEMHCRNRASGQMLSTIDFQNNDLWNLSILSGIYWFLSASGTMLLAP